MSKRLLKVILILVSLLFLNIEAAQAGLVNKLRLYIRAEFPPHQLALILFVVFTLAAFCYIIFTPLSINNERWSWYNYFSFQPEKGGFKNKRALVKRINNILSQESKP
jgi:hypothetical protein